jgi:ABC-2 type transport system permease protein
MIRTILRISVLNLRRDRVAQALTFLLPVMFFSIFASVFGNQRDATSRIPVAVADEDQSEYSKRLVQALAAEGGLRVQTTKTRDGSGPVLDRAGAEALVRAGNLSVAVVIPKGMGARPNIFEANDSGPKILVLADVSDPVAPQMVTGLLQKVAFTAVPDLMATDGMAMLEKYGGALTPEQRRTLEQWKQSLAAPPAPGTPPSSTSGVPGLPIEVVNLLQPGGGSSPTVSFYAAGIGVMFLLFSCAGAGGTLLEEEESGTLGRLIGSRAGMAGVLTGKWLFLTILGVLQLTVMFAWGALVFNLPLLSHLPGFFVMTVVTAAAAGAFGLLLATISRSRAQLSGISTIVILAMSAVGGSMFPRFLMSETMQRMGLLTFNGWALDGYIKVFWRDAPVAELWPQVLVLSLLCGAFLMSARLFARRWERL